VSWILVSHLLGGFKFVFWTARRTAAETWTRTAEMYSHNCPCAVLHAHCWNRLRPQRRFRRKRPLKLGAHWIGSARLGTIRRGKTQWKQMEGCPLHRPGSAQTPSAHIGTVPEYRTEQNVPKVRSVRKANNCFEAKSFMCFFCSNTIFIIVSWKQVKKN
jgi:hypothetical protein